MPKVAVRERPNPLLDDVVESLSLSPDEVKCEALVRMPAGNCSNLAFYDRDASVSEADRFVNSLAVLLLNAESADLESIRSVTRTIDRLAAEIDAQIDDYVHRVLHSPTFKELETSWRSLAHLCKSVQQDDVVIDFLDVTKEELGADLEDHASDIFGSALFKKIYVNEYDSYGGKPFGSMISLYDFDSSDADLDWLQTMAKVAQAAHAPFVGSVKPEFFGLGSFDKLEPISNIENELETPKYNRWNEFRESDEAAYVGLTLPRFLLRSPWNQEMKSGRSLAFTEKIRDKEEYLWGKAAVLFATNMVRSFQSSGWCQHIRGPRGGGLIKHLPVHMVERHGKSEMQPPVEIAIPDFRELQFANAGFIPLIHCAGTGSATFFSARSAKKARRYEDDLATKNADLVCNPAYTFSITRIAHCTKRMVRDYIGSSADGLYIQKRLSDWLNEYVTAAVDPDDLTLLYYPFKKVAIEVVPKPGPLGWYSSIISVLPHAQFEGMDVELRLEAALGGGG